MSIDDTTRPNTYHDGYPPPQALDLNDNEDALENGINTLTAAINAAAGLADTLQARLDASTNPDGTLRDAITAGGEWINPAYTIVSNTSDTITITGNTTAVHIPNKRVKITDSVRTVYADVLTAVFSSPNTVLTITNYDFTLSTGVTKVENSILTPTDLSSRSVNLRGNLAGNADTATTCTGNAATATTCTGNAATATTCTGNAATATTCTGNAATATTCTGNADTITGTYTSVPLGENFPNGIVDYSKAGHIVTITFQLGAHTAGVVLGSAAGVIPADYRRSNVVHSVYQALLAGVFDVELNSFGTLTFTQRDWAGNTFSSGVDLHGTFSYVIP